MGLAADIAKRRGGRPSGNGYLIPCPVPTHGKGRGDRSPSCFIQDGETALLVHCYAGCPYPDITASLRADGDLPEDDNRHHQGRHRSRQTARARPSAIEPHAASLALWREAQPADGTLTEYYLRQHRNIARAIPPSIRHHPDVKYQPSGLCFPAMIAGIQDGTSRRVIAVQIVYLDPQGRGKATVSRAKMFLKGARLGGGAVRLAAAIDEVGITEGVEDGLSAQQLTGLPVWCALGCARFASIDLPPPITCVSIFAQNDKPGIDTAERAARRFTAEGRRVLIRRPPDGFADWNDWHRAGTPEA